MPDLMQHASRFIDTMLEHGTDRYGDEHSPMFASVLDTVSLAIPDRRPPAIPGQRESDRAHGGGNLMHDIPLLGTMYALAEGLGRQEYAAAADAYLDFFAQHCTSTVSGLFPWGEHAYWDFYEERPGNGYQQPRPFTHDHLRQAPVWFWEKMWARNPYAVIRFADALYQHITEPETFEYSRHAPILARAHQPIGDRSFDFPRHGGFYILDWSFAYVNGGVDHHLHLAKTMDAYHHGHLDRWGGLPIESRTPVDDPVGFHAKNSPVQELSLGFSLLEAADLIEGQEADTARTWREHAHIYVDGFFNAPHDLEKGIYAVLSDQVDNSVFKEATVWGSRYGAGAVGSYAVLCVGLYRRLGEDRLLDWAVAVDEAHQQTPIPDDVQMPAIDMGHAIALAADLYDVTGEERFLQRAVARAETAIERYATDSGLLRGALGIDWYESQMGVAYLVHALARTAALQESRTDCFVLPDYTAR